MTQADVPARAQRDRTVAVGGERTVPVPDPVARDYLLLALRLGQRIPGLVDGYFGPADLKAQVDLEQLPAPDRLVEDAIDLRSRVPAEVPESDRREWLARQLVALETHARTLAGARPVYAEEIEHLFDWSAQRRDDALFDAAAAEIDRLLPGAGTVAERLAHWDASVVVPPDRLAAIARWLADRYRDVARSLFGLPQGEALRVEIVRGRTWSGYNWYEGGLRSRVDINADLPVRLPTLLATVAHETYPGHHLEHAWKEADLVERQGRLEASVLLMDAPECLMSEGLAELGFRFVAPTATRVDLLAEALDVANVPAAPTREAAREVAGQAAALVDARKRLEEIAVNAALLRHGEGRPRAEVEGYLVDVGRMEPARAAKRLDFIEAPLTRPYVVVYAEGEALLGRWLDAVPEADRAARFVRLLHEQLTPSAIARDLEGGRVSAPSTTPPGSRS
jgi:hypothetical protein